MIFKTQQKLIEFDLPPHRKQVIIKMSGGADSTILAYCLALYKKEERPDLKLYVVTLNSVSPRNYHVKNAKRVMDKITELTGVEFERHYTKDLVEPGFDDTTLSTEEWRKASPYTRTSAEMVKELKKEIQIDNDPKNRPLHYSGITKNPPTSLSMFYEDWYASNGIKGNWITERDANTIRDEGSEENYEYWRQPFTNIDKRAVYQLYAINNVVDDLFPLTRSCESDAKGQQILDGGPEEHCGKCWWCLERQWAFGRLV